MDTRAPSRHDKLLESLADGPATAELTLGFAEVQGMVRHWHPESLSRVDVSPRVVVALGVLLLGGGGRIEEEQQQEEETRSEPEHTEEPPLVRVEDAGLHRTVSRRARKVTDWQQRVATQLGLERFEGEFLPPSLVLLLLLQGGFSAAGSLIVSLPPSSGTNVNTLKQALKGSKCSVAVQRVFLYSFESGVIVP